MNLKKFRKGDVVMVVELPDKYTTESSYWKGKEFYGHDLSIGSIHKVTNIEEFSLSMIIDDRIWVMKQFFEKIGEL